MFTQINPFPNSKTRIGMIALRRLILNDGSKYIDALDKTSETA
jgi:hypothetical protein